EQFLDQVAADEARRPRDQHLHDRTFSLAALGRASEPTKRKTSTSGWRNFSPRYSSWHAPMKTMSARSSASASGTNARSSMYGSVQRTSLHSNVSTLRSL